MNGQENIYGILSKEDMVKMCQLNAENCWGMTNSELQKLCETHGEARKKKDFYTMSLIEFRLTDLNYHQERELIAKGRYKDAIDLI